MTTLRMTTAKKTRNVVEMEIPYFMNVVDEVQAELMREVSA
jgi:hypothetical protein